MKFSDFSVVGGNESRTQEEDESMDEDCRRGSVAPGRLKDCFVKMPINEQSYSTQKCNTRVTGVTLKVLESSQVQAKFIFLLSAHS